MQRRSGALTLSDVEGTVQVDLASPLPSFRWHSQEIRERADACIADKHICDVGRLGLENPTTSGALYLNDRTLLHLLRRPVAMHHSVTGKCRARHCVPSAKSRVGRCLPEQLPPSSLDTSPRSAPSTTEPLSQSPHPRDSAGRIPSRRA